jgi:hypothetical protein
MKADALARLLSIARGKFEAVTATGRNGRSRVTPKSPEITPLRPLRPENDKGANGDLASAVRNTRPDNDVAQIEEGSNLAAATGFSAETETERWHRVLAEKVEIIVKVRGLPPRRRARGVQARRNRICKRDASQHRSARVRIVQQA